LIKPRGEWVTVSSHIPTLDIDYRFLSTDGGDHFVLDGSKNDTSYWVAAPDSVTTQAIGQLPPIVFTWSNASAADHTTEKDGAAPDASPANLTISVFGVGVASVQGAEAISSGSCENLTATRDCGPSWPAGYPTWGLQKWSGSGWIPYDADGWPDGCTSHGASVAPGPLAAGRYLATATGQRVGQSAAKGSDLYISLFGSRVGQIIEPV
jgi:hypothetical protein